MSTTTLLARCLLDGTRPARVSLHREPLNAWYDVRALPGPAGLFVFFLEVTDRRRAQEQAEVAGRRLSAPPRSARDQAEIVVRYLPASEAAAVGGDWYDAFCHEDGSTLLVIGDVVGHDIAAAANMGQLRGLLRGVATSSDAGPAEVLTSLDRSMERLEVQTFATVAVARFEQTDEERARGVTRMRWASAGHPPPVVVSAAGDVAALTRPPELMLGVDTHARRTEEVLLLDAGTTVLLYTDGLIERRDADLDIGLEQLRAAVAKWAHLPLPQLSDHLLEDLVQGRPDDDVALVGLRLNPATRS